MALTFGSVTASRVNIASGLGSPSAFTLMTWIYPTTITSLRRLWAYNANDGTSYLHEAFWTGTTALDFRVIRTGGIASCAAQTGTFSTNKWWFVGCTYDETDGPRIFVGDLTTPVAEVTYAAARTLSSGTTRTAGETNHVIANAGTGSAFQGRIAGFVRAQRRMELDELRAQQWGFRPEADWDLYLELGFEGTGTQANRAPLANAKNGTQTSTSVADHVPVMPAWARQVEILALPATVATNLSGQTDSTSTVSGGMSAGAQLGGTVTCTSSVGGQITTPGATLSGTVASASTVSGTVAAPAALTGAVASTSSVTGLATVPARLAGTTASVSTVDGQFQTSQFGGLVTATSSVAGTLTVPARLAGTVTSTSSASGQVTAATTLTGSTASTSSVAGLLTAPARLAGTTAATSTVSGQLAGGTFGGTVTATSSVAGLLTAPTRLTGSTASTSTVAGTVTAVARLAGTTAAASSVAGGFTLGPYTGLVTSTSTVAGTLTTITRLFGSVTAVSTVDGQLTVVSSGDVGGSSGHLVAGGSSGQILRSADASSGRLVQPLAGSVT